MSRRRLLYLSAVLAGIVANALAPPARADFEVQFSYLGASITYDATTNTTTASGGASISGATIKYNAAKEQITIANLTLSNTGTTGGFTIDSVISKSNSPGTSNVATITMSGLNFVNQTGISGNSSLTVMTGDTGFKMPSLAQGILKSTISATTDAGNLSTASVVFNSYLDTTNAQFGMQQGSPQIHLANIGANVSQSGNTWANVDASGTPYSLTQVARITLANGDSFTDGSSGTSLVAPAPAGWALALSGSGLCLAYLRIRRKLPLS